MSTLPLLKSSVDRCDRAGVNPVGRRTSGLSCCNAAGGDQRGCHNHQCRACEQNSDRFTHRFRNLLDTNPLDHLYDDFSINSKGATTVTGSRMWRNSCKNMSADMHALNVHVKPLFRTDRADDTERGKSATRPQAVPGGCPGHRACAPLPSPHRRRHCRFSAA